MRVLLVNAFHYLRGGVERTYLDESRWLTEAGHDVAHLATRTPQDLPSPTAALFAPAADFGEGAPLLGQLGQWGRVLWSWPAADAAARVLQAFRPDVVHLHAPSRYLTPSVLGPIERARIPAVMTLHDFKPWCTNRLLFAHGAPCERCRGGRHWHALATGCVQGSRVKSAVAMVEAYAHDAMHAYRGVGRWIAPSRFVYDKAIAYGVARDSLRLLHHGVASPAAGAASAPSPPGHAERFAFYSGRLSLEKGVRLLPAIAARIAPVPLVVAGDGPLRAELERAANTVPTLRVLGRVDDATLAALRAAAAVVVVPSLFYEHFCYAAAEALLDARPVVASAIGAIPELVRDEDTGLLAPAGDADAFGAAVRRALDDPRAAAWGSAGRLRVRELADPARHLAGLVAIYEEALASGAR